MFCILEKLEVNFQLPKLSHSITDLGAILSLKIEAYKHDPSKIGMHIGEDV